MYWNETKQMIEPENYKKYIVQTTDRPDIGLKLQLHSTFSFFYLNSYLHALLNIAENDRNVHLNHLSMGLGYVHGSTNFKLGDRQQCTLGWELQGQLKKALFLAKPQCNQTVGHYKTPFFKSKHEKHSFKF